MPRPERALFPHLNPLHAFAAALRELRRQAGNPTYKKMERATGRSDSALAEAAGGDTWPTWETVDAYVSYCGGDPGDYVALWERAGAWRDREPQAEPVALFNLPRRPASVFVGRDGSLAVMRELLERPSAGVVIGPVVHGLGGVGKTELALQYAHAHRARHQVTWWIPADTADSLAAGLAVLTRELEPHWPASAGVGDAAAWALRWLAGHEGWLLVLDNVADPAVIQGVLAAASHGRVIVTSRRFLDWQALGLTPVALPVLSPQDSVELLMRRTGRTSERDDAQLLAEDLGGLTLAVSHAAAYLVERPHVTVKQYRSRLTEQPSRMLMVQSRSRPDDEVVARTWQVSLEAMAQEDPLAARILDLVAYVGADRIPVELLVPLADPLAVDDAVAVMASYSMVARTGDQLSIHPIVQTVIRTTHPSESTEHGPVADALRLLDAALPPGDPEIAVEDWGRWSRLAPHIEALAGHVSDHRIGDMLLRCALYHRGQGRYASAVALFQRSYDIRLAELGPDHPDTLTSLYGLAGGHWSAGDHERGITLGQAAFLGRLRVLGPEHPDSLHITANYAVGLRELGRYDEATALSEEALRSREKVLGPDHADTLRSRNNLAGCYRALGRHDEAIALYEFTHAARARLLGPSHPDTLQSHHNLGGGYAAACRHAEAAAVAEQTLAVRAELLGPDHPDTANTRLLLGTAYECLGRLERALAAYEQTLRSRESMLGPHHPDSVQARRHVAALSERASEFDNLG